MGIPDYQSIMLPLLKFLADFREYSFRETVEGLAREFKLTDEERKDMLPSGQQATFDNRVGWARTYLKQAGLIEYPQRGYLKITKRGEKTLAQNPNRIDVKFLERFEEFLEFRKRKKQKPKIPKPSDDSTSVSSDKTPAEALETAFQELQEGLATELLQTITACPPEFFERLVINILIGMGYGGSRKEAGQAIGRSGDGGIDGIIKEDKLGLDIIYVQAKRWENTVVGRPEIQKFAGALQGQRARKGIFITTSTFSKEAQEYVKNIESKIILIDGQRLAELMIEYNIGVSTVSTYEIKKIDTDYFID
jgi:restriction system protein